MLIVSLMSVSLFSIVGTPVLNKFIYETNWSDFELEKLADRYNDYQEDMNKKAEKKEKAQKNKEKSQKDTEDSLKK